MGNTNQQRTVSIYGVGNFGYAILKHLDNKHMSNIRLRAYDIDSGVLDSLRSHHTHAFLHTDVSVSKNIDFVDSPAALVEDADVIVLAVASQATRIVARTIKPHLKKNVVLLNSAKALDADTGKRLSEILAEELGNIPYTYAQLAGGTIANDLFRHEPLGIDIACEDAAALRQLHDLFSSENLSVYTSSDVAGTEYAGAFKNIVSVVAGMVHGLGFSYGSETHIISRLAEQIGEVCCERLGANPATFSIGSQCWGNDLWMSCTGNTRNRQFGILLGQGLSPHEAQEEMKRQKKTVEALNTIAMLELLPELKSITTLHLLYDVVIAETKTRDDFRKHLIGGFGGH